MAEQAAADVRVGEYLITPAVDGTGWCVVADQRGDLFWSPHREACATWAAGATTEAAAKNAEIARLRVALAFAASCIKAGESWSPMCEDVIVGAMRQESK